MVFLQSLEAKLCDRNSKFLSLNSLKIILSAHFIYKHAHENVADKRHTIHTEHIINNNWLILLVVHF